MILSSGQIPAETSADSVNDQFTLYQCPVGKTANIRYMQFVSESNLDVNVNLWLLLFSGEVRIIPKDTIMTGTQILQFDVDYDLRDGEQLLALVSAKDVIHYLITGTEADSGD